MTQPVSFDYKGRPSKTPCHPSAFSNSDKLTNDICNFQTHYFWDCFLFVDEHHNGVPAMVFSHKLPLSKLQGYSSLLENCKIRINHLIHWGLNSNVWIRRPKC